MKVRGMLLAENNVINGRSQRELEYTFLGLIKDFNELDRASRSEDYEQWTMTTNDSMNKGEVSGTVRVRSVNSSKFSMTVKHRQRSKTMANESMETEVPITRDMFDSFKRLAPMGLVKTRYFFPIEGTDLEWELDVFTMPDGDSYEWCMLDLEVKGELDEIPDPPIELIEFINTKKKSAKDFVDGIMSKVQFRNYDNILPMRR
jgi:hypothetical protein